MELADLHVFRTVVQAGGVTRASERLHRVQSNVTTRIKKLEEDLGAALFLRIGRRLELTPAGRILLDYTDQLLDLADRAREALQDTTPRGVLRLGAPETTAAVRLPGLLARMHELYPQLSLEVSSRHSRELVVDVLTGELDAALVAEAISDPRLGTCPAYLEELVVIAQVGHPPIITARDVKTRAILAPHPNCSYRKRLEEWFKDAEVPIERFVEVTSYHAILGCAVAGMGIALLPRSVLDSYGERRHLSIHEIAPRFSRAPMTLIWRKISTNSRVDALSKVITAQVADAQLPKAAKKGRHRKTGNAN